MARNVTQKLVADHLVDGDLQAGSEIGLRIDQTLTQDATGTLVMLELEAMQVDRVKTALSAQYVDHNLLQEDFRNPDDHVFLRSACRKLGVWFSRAGNGVSHPTHMQRFGKPGKTLLGSDSHTCAAGSLGMLAIGAGGLEVAMAMAGEPFHLEMPKVMGVKLTGKLPDWVSAKDVILEMLRRHGVDGGTGYVIEYYGPGLESLNAMDRHVIANMGAELGATTSVFPADDVVRDFLEREQRGDDFSELLADKGAEYDEHDEIDLGNLEPLIATPSSPGNVVPVREVAGKSIFQSYIGSSANPGLRDMAVPAMMVSKRAIAPGVSFDINPTSRQILENMARNGYLEMLLHAGARLHQAGCNGCIGMGQAPASNSISLRTVPRNFPGRSGTREDKVYLCSPETATASAIRGEITDPRDLDMDYPSFTAPEENIVNRDMLEAPAERSKDVEFHKGPNIRSLPEFEPLPDELSLPVTLKTGDDVSTDEIMPAGAKILPFRSNIPEISRFVFHQYDPDFHERALEHQESGHVLVGGRNYGQGSSREHAAIAPRFLGVRVVIAKSFARIHWQNLVNFGILPLTFKDDDDYERISQGDEITFRDLHQQLSGDGTVEAGLANDDTLTLVHHLSERQLQIIMKGSLLAVMREKTD